MGVGGYGNRVRTVPGRTGSLDPCVAICGGNTGDAGACERGDSHVPLGGIFLLVSKNSFHQALDMDGVRCGAIIRHHVLAVSVGSDRIRPGAFEWARAPVGVNSVWVAEPRISANCCCCRASELLETGIIDGPPPISGGLLRSAFRNGVLFAQGDRVRRV